MWWNIEDEEGQSPTNHADGMPTLTWRLFTRPNFFRFPGIPQTIKTVTKLLTLEFSENILLSNYSKLQGLSLSPLVFSQSCFLGSHSD